MSEQFDDPSVVEFLSHRDSKQHPHYRSSVVPSDAFVTIRVRSRGASGGSTSIMTRGVAA